MHIKVRPFSNVLIFSAIFFAVHARADRHHHEFHHEKAFALNAARPELIEAYLTKCAEAHFLAHELKESKACHWSSKNMKQSFACGAVVGLAASALLYIVTR